MSIPLILASQSRPRRDVLFSAGRVMREERRRLLLNIRTRTITTRMIKSNTTLVMCASFPA